MAPCPDPCSLAGAPLVPRAGKVLGGPSSTLQNPPQPGLLVNLSKTGPQVPLRMWK